MTSQELSVFAKKPEVLPLYEVVREGMLREFPDVQIRPKNTQVGFFAKYGFAWAWLPIRKMKDMPEVAILVSFGLDHEVQSPRIAQAVNPYPNRWTHHVIFSDPAEWDDELVGWLRQAYNFRKG